MPSELNEVDDGSSYDDAKLWIELRSSLSERMAGAESEASCTMHDMQKNLPLLGHTPHQRLLVLAHHLLFRMSNQRSLLQLCGGLEGLRKLWGSSRPPQPAKPKVEPGNSGERRRQPLVADSHPALVLSWQCCGRPTEELAELLNNGCSVNPTLPPSANPQYPNDHQCIAYQCVPDSVVACHQLQPLRPTLW